MKFWLKIIKEGNGLGVLFFLSLLIITMGLLSPIFIIHIFNRYITFGLEGTLFFLVSGAVSVAIFEFIFRNIRHNFCSKIIINPIKSIKISILKTFFDNTFLNKKKRLTNAKFLEILDVNNNIYQILNPQNQSNILDSFFAIIIIIILFLFNVKLASIFLFILMTTLIIQNLNLKKINNFLKLKQKRSIKNHNVIFDIKDKSDFLKSTNSFKFIGSNYSNFASVQLNDSAEISKINSSINNFTHFIIILNSIIIIGIGSTYVVNGDFSIGTLIGFNIFSTRALQISLSAQKSIINFKQIYQYIGKTQDFFKQIKSNDSGMKLLKMNGNIEIKNLNFNHENSSTMLFKRFSTKFDEGKISSITGGNGTGKTTLCKIILGIIRQDSGEVLIDSVNLQKFSMNWWTNQVGFVPQNTFSLNATIFDNIAIGNEKLNEEEISRLISTVGLTKDLEKSDLNLDDPISSNVSLGIHKKIHLARVLALNPKIFLFDDPLESLDIQGKKYVKNLLLSLKKANKTIICMSNDNEIIDISDKVINLDE